MIREKEEKRGKERRKGTNVKSAEPAWTSKPQAMLVPESRAVIGGVLGEGKKKGRGQRVEGGRHEATSELTQ